MAVLSDGSVLPSFFGVGTGGSAFKTLTNNSKLKIGTVIKVYYPDDAANISKTEIEYDVRVAENDNSKATNTSIYRNCRLSNNFGNNNNTVSYTFFEDSPDKEAKTNGSQVLLMCIDGRSDASSAVIIGGVSVKNSQRILKKYKREDGQFYDFNFNGINFNINKNGELKFEFSSPIDLKGKLANEKAAGSKWFIDKNGRIEFNDNEKQSLKFDRVAQNIVLTNSNEIIRVDKKNKEIFVKSTGEINVESAKTTSMKSDDKMDLSSKSDMSLKTDANMNMDVKQNLTVKANSNVNIQSQAGISVKSGGNISMKSGGIAQLQGTVTMLGAGSVPVAAVGVSIAMGIGNLGAPVVSTILTGSGTVLVGT